ncbi:MAG: DNA-directed RNA polymerase subunit beta [Rickettsiales bacterium]|nr:DNA-directed RNA polymerase subunit beta [Rickettsiales bacterium]OUV82719.1 MAG: DNA-directed RNA polymerase subunit beta [Rickettsiales bacterium TMED131]
MSKNLSLTNRRSLRHSFGMLSDTVNMPNLIEIQKHSYQMFLESGLGSDKKSEMGIQDALKSIFPVKDYAGRMSLKYISYKLDRPKYDVIECRQRGLTYSAALKVTFRLDVVNIDEDTGNKIGQDAREEEVYLGDIPLMTDKATFVVNGTERVIVSQMHRSPGVFFDNNNAARVIPYRGSWLDIEFDAKDLLFIRIDRRKKLSIVFLLKSMGMSNEEVLDYFYHNSEIIIEKDSYASIAYDFNDLKGEMSFDLIDAKTNKLLLKKGERLTSRHSKGFIEKGLERILVPIEEIYGRFFSEDIFNESTGEVFAEAGEEIDENKIDSLLKENIKKFKVIIINDKVGPYVRNSLLTESSATRTEALAAIYKIMRPGEPPTEESSEKLFYDLFFSRFEGKNDTTKFFNHPKDENQSELSLDKDIIEQEGAWILKQENDWSLVTVGVLARKNSKHNFWVKNESIIKLESEKYDLSAVGRVKLNARLNSHIPEEFGELQLEDILQVIKIVINLKDGIGECDDIDHLGNRRVRSVGELIENQFRMGLIRMERSIKERMGSITEDKLVPKELVNAKPLTSVLREFFGSSQLSQFMDQTNPLSEITHKRRLSALGPGGLTRERAGFEVRDVHPTHYGRICPIETPEGPNIGLINSLATYSKINNYGFIESPYRKVKEGKVTNEVEYLSAIDEDKYCIAQANAPLTKTNEFVRDLVSCRKDGDFIMSTTDKIDYMDVSPKQLVSVAASLIPFLENDDANRALMGSNMMRQAVPLVINESPMVGTGMEAVVAKDSSAAVVAKRGGFVEQVDAKRIVIRHTDEEKYDVTLGVDVYNLLKFQRSNQNTAINQRPLVRVGDRVESGDVIADGPATDQGELALGKNVLVAFMPWNGYNYEDSILISERIVRDDVFTSIHIEEFELMARDTKLGPEEITRDIPNVGEESLKNLDETGIVYIGAEVKPNDILVGKVTPKGETPMTPEEKLLRAIFGEKASDVRDTSLKLPAGVSGTVVEVRVFNRRGVEKDERALAIEKEEIERLAKDRDDQIRIIEENIHQRLKSLLVGKQVAKSQKGIKTGQTITEKFMDEMNKSDQWKLTVKNQKNMDELENLKTEYDAEMKEISLMFSEKVDKVQSGDDLLPGVLKMVKVFVAVKRKLQPGDKMAGRHGNKGVISKIAPIEDMPYTEEGVPVDIVLNPLGVPSRMNVGQILETHLGWASAGLGKKIKNIINDAQSDLKAKSNSCRKALKAFFKPKYYEERISSLKDEEVIELMKKTKSGVNLATPVFDGAKNDDIVELLKLSGLDESGQVNLIDGRTGEMFDRKVTVGYIYMLKLHHLVDDKIHSRSIGPYSLVTQQPLGGKAQFGGQRFGEMEVWALQAYGASYTLQEMLTVKSDDVAGRGKVYESIVRGETNFEAGVPESFNVLVKEMQSLCLDVALSSDKVSKKIKNNSQEN